MILDAEHLRSLRGAMGLVGHAFPDLPEIPEDLWMVHQVLLGLMAEDAVEARKTATEEGPTLVEEDQ